MRNAELVGKFSRILWSTQKDETKLFVIASVIKEDGSTETIKGEIVSGEIEQGVTYRFFGYYRNNPKYGNQFQFSSCVLETPVTEDAIIAYLESCGKKERGGITSRIARTLFEQHGFSAIEKLIADPVAVSKSIKRWEESQAVTAARYLQSQLHVQKTKLDLIELLSGQGFPKKTVDLAIKMFGVRAVGTIKEDPYVLMKFPGIGFKAADKFYCELAKQQSSSPDEFEEKMSSMRRQSLSALYTLNTQIRSTGSTWIHTGIIEAGVRNLIGRVQSQPEEAIQFCEQEGWVIRSDSVLSTKEASLHELEIAEFISFSSPGHDWPDARTVSEFAPEGKPLSDHQVEAINQALTGRVCCLQGSPGVGKTFTVACIVKAILSRYGQDVVAAAAPTGKAAVRMTQSLVLNDVPVVASTIHRLLGVTGESGGSWSFNYNRENNLPYQFLVLDESSMIDTDLMASLLRACSSSMNIIFVGDSNQLAPVGHGRPFLDLQMCVPTGHLTEIRRNAGRIVKACASIRDSRSISFSKGLDLPEENLLLLSGENQIEHLELMLARLENEGVDCLRDVQVLTAKNAGSPVARKPVNELMQQMLNRRGASATNHSFRVGDKIVCLKNGQYDSVEEAEEKLFVANGELGTVLEIKPGKIQVILEDPARLIWILHSSVVTKDESEESDSRGAVSDWDLGYCLSVHRSQGSQWKYVIILIDKSGGPVHTRNWIYTAISRAEIAAFVIGEMGTIQQMLRVDGIVGRRTRLIERIWNIKYVQT